MQRGNAIEKVGGGAQAAARAKRAANDADSRNLVNSLAKGLRVLESFTAERPELTLSEVAALAKLDPGTSFRMLNTLVMAGYVSRIPDSKRFRLTLKVTDLGLHAIGRADLREIARPILRSLVGEVNEAASLGVLDGADILLYRARACRPDPHRRRYSYRYDHPGVLEHDRRGDAGLSAAGGIVARPCAATASAAFPHKPMKRERDQKSLQNVRENGYALRDSYFGSGLRVLAVPVLDVDNYPLAAVSVAVPQMQMTIEGIPRRALDAVQRAARDIARAIQASGAVSAIACQ